MYYGYALVFQLNQVSNRAKKFTYSSQAILYLFLEIYSHNSIEHDILKDKSVGLTVASPPIQNISKGRGHG